jgi:hypothetical protein
MEMVSADIIKKYGKFPEKTKKIGPLPKQRKPWSRAAKRRHSKIMKEAHPVAWNKGMKMPKHGPHLQRRVGIPYARKTDSLFVIPVVYRGHNFVKK